MSYYDESSDTCTMRYIYQPKTYVRVPDPERTRVGAVLTFGEGVTVEQVQAAIAKLGIEVTSDTVQTYDANHGGPVFYIL